MTSGEKILHFLRNAADSDGNASVTVELIVQCTGLSRASVFRSLAELERDEYIDVEARRGPGGGYRIGLKKVSKIGLKKVSKRSQNRDLRDAFPRGAAPTGPSPTLANSSHELVSPNPTPAVGANPRPPAYRAARDHEIPESGTDIVYVNDPQGGYWKRITPTRWEAPNGDAVSIRNMTPALRNRLGIDRNPADERNAGNARDLRGLLE